MATGVTHIAGPPRRGSRQVTQRCVRCGYPLIIEAHDEMIPGYAPGTAVTVEDGEQVSLDERYRHPPPVRLCAQRRGGKQRIRLR